MGAIVIPDMEVGAVEGDYVEHDLTFHDGTTRHVYVTEVEEPYPDGKLIVSRTDLAGNIIMVNDAFVYMSGYTEDELMGMPQHILRHPDVPTAVFQEVWDTISDGRKWYGYLKNHRKNGGYYWVYAAILPNVRNGEIYSYTSVRRKPSRRKVDEAAESYAAMRTAGAL